MLTDREAQRITEIGGRLRALRTVLLTSQIPQTAQIAAWYALLSKIKSVQGNLSNDISFIATCLAKEYLSREFEVEFDAAEKPQGAPGLDIDLITPRGERIIAEVKTTYPYKEDDLGAQQYKAFERDFEKLNSERADFKFFFLTEGRTFEVVKMRRYHERIPGVRVVLLPSGDCIVG